MSDLNLKDLLKDTSLKVEKLDTYLKERGVIVGVSFGGGRNAYKISPKAFGVKKENLSEESQVFLDKNIRNGSVTFVPIDKYKDLRAIEGRVKKRLREISIGYNNSFVPLKSFGEFLEYFNKAKVEYLAIGTELSDQFSIMLDTFKDVVEKSIIDLDAYDAAEEYMEIMGRIPTKEAFKNAFRADLEISLFPTMQDFEGVDSSIQNLLKEQYSQIGNSLIGDSVVSLLDEISSALISVLRSEKKQGNIHHKVISGLKNATERLAEKNVFGNEKIEKIRLSMTNMISSDTDTIMENSERLLAEIYVYSKELKIDNKVDLRGCPLTRDELSMIHSLYA